MRELSFRDAINEALRLAMRRDHNVILIGEDLAGGADVAHLQGDEAVGGTFGATKELVQEFGRNRVLDTPISESGFIGAAVAAAISGLRPVPEIMLNDFIGVCLDQIMNHAAKMRYMFGGQAHVPLTIRTTHGAGFGGSAQHSQSLYAIATHIPGLKVVVPSTPSDVKGLLLAAINDDDPVIFFEDKTIYSMVGEVPEGYYEIPLGKADIKRSGTDVTIVAIGKQVHTALAAAEELQQKGISAEVIDPRSLSPLDETTILASVAKTHHLIVVDEANPRCGAAADIAALVATKGFADLRGAIQLVTAPHTPVPYSPVLEAEYLPNPQKIVAAALEILSEIVAL